MRCITRVTLRDLEGFACDSHNPLAYPYDPEVCRAAQRIWERWNEELLLRVLATEILAAPPSKIHNLDEHSFMP